MLYSKVSQGTVFLANESKIVPGREYTIGAIWQMKYFLFTLMLLLLWNKIKKKKSNLHIKGLHTIGNILKLNPSQALS